MTAPVESGSAYQAVAGFSGSVGVSVSTTGTDKQLFAFASNRNNAQSTISGGGLTWIKLGGVTLDLSGDTSVVCYTATAPTAITAQTITATQGGGSTSMVIFVQAFADSQDYASLVANTDFGLTTFAQAGSVTTNVYMDVTTKAADSQLFGAVTFFGTDGDITWTNATDNSTVADQGQTIASRLLKRSDAPLAVGTYTSGATHTNTNSWRGAVGIAVEILGTGGGGGGGISIPVVMNQLRNQGIA